MQEHSPHIDVRPGSERSFGLVFAAVFAAIALYPLVYGEGIWWPAAGLAAALAGVAAVAPRLFGIPNRLWFRFGMLLGRIVSPIIMSLVYVVAVVPTGMVMRLAGKDPLRLARDDKLATYWIERDWPMQPMDQQF